MINDQFYLDGFEEALKIFKLAAKRVPAYTDFLKKHKIDSEKINSISDFSLVPLITKENYLKQYPIKDLLIDGDTQDARIISMSSGSSGQPFFWFRGNLSVTESASLLSDVYENSFQVKEKETLCIIAFAMGTWIAGTYVLTANNALADEGFRIVSITPGINLLEIMKIIDKIGPQFEQIIIAGYPPFIKDLIDEANAARIDLEHSRIKLLFAGENFSEDFRDYLMKSVGSSDSYKDTASIYGTADAGIVGIENQFSIFIRRFLSGKRNLISSVFPGTEILPSLVTYNPRYRYFEQLDNKIVFTTNNTLPLVRYNILDEGAVIQATKIVDICLDNGMRMPKSIMAHSTEHLVAIYGRQDVATMFYSLNIYPENIKYGLENKSLIAKITGKFVVASEYQSNQSQKLKLAVELKKDIVESQLLKQTVAREIIRGLEETNSEYRKLRSEIKRKSDPEVSLLPFGSPQFSIKIKHKWVSKS